LSRENVEIVRRLWKAVERRDIEAVFSLYDPSIVWENHTGGPIELLGEPT
jgi:ketosteroid isomerase-like protein